MVSNVKQKQATFSIKHKLLIIGSVALLASSLALLLDAGLSPWMNMVYHRFAHILGAILFMGNIVVGAYWMIRADIRKDPIWFAEVMAQINLADLIFTVPGAILLVVNGEVLLSAWRGSSIPGWLAQALYLFVGTGFLWAITSTDFATNGD